jgi:hypothetical protein
MKEKANINPDWVLTKTVRGTPIAITKILPCVGEGGGVTGHEFLVVPRYNDGSSTIASVKSEDVVKPVNFKDEEQKKLFDEIVFGGNNDLNDNEKDDE